jgi:hypothetical protein
MELVEKLEHDVWWDLNIWFKDLGQDEDGINQWEDVLSISPSIYEDYPMHHYTDIVFKTTFAETRYIQSVRPIEQYGDDWFEDLDSFLEVAPPRVAEWLRSLGSAEEYFQKNFVGLVG